MRHEIIIRMLVPLIHKTDLPNIYSIGDELRIMGTDGKFWRGSVSQMLSATPQAPYQMPHHKPIPFNIDNKLEERFIYNTFVNDAGNEEGVTVADKRMKEAAEVFYANHPNVRKGNRDHANVSNPMFTMIDTAEQTVEGLVSYENMDIVRDKIRTMTIDELRNITYWFGHSPKGKTEGELKLLLANVDPNVPPHQIDGIGYLGICLRNAKTPDGKETNIERFIRVWVKGSARDRDMKVILQKAVDYNVIQNNKKSGMDAYYLGQTPIGNSIDDMIVYFSKEEQMYNDFVLRGVKEKENFKTEDKDTVIQNDSMSATVVITDNDLKALQDEADLLRKEGFIPAKPYRGMKYHTILPVVEEGRKAKNQKEALASFAKSQEKVTT